MYRGGRLETAKTGAYPCSAPFREAPCAEIQNAVRRAAGRLGSCVQSTVDWAPLSCFKSSSFGRAMGFVRAQREALGALSTLLGASGVSYRAAALFLIL